MKRSNNWDLWLNINGQDLSHQYDYFYVHNLFILYEMDNNDSRVEHSLQDRK